MTYSFFSAPLLLIGVIFLFQGNCFSCKNDDCPTGLTFRTPYSVSPMLDTFSVGDTLWVEMNFPAELTDESNTLTAQFDNYDFNFELACEQINIDPKSGYTTEIVDLQPFLGDGAPNIYGSFSVYGITPISENGYYKFKSILTLKKSGLILLTINPFNNEYDPYSVPNTECKTQIWGKLTNSNQNNYFMLKYASLVYSNKSEEEMTGCYIFFVK